MITKKKYQRNEGTGNAEWPIRLEMEDGDLAITCKGIPEQEAVKLVKKIFEE